MGLSVFEIIGPPMVGPSSSHTAGACRIGWAARELLGGTPEFARIGLHGSFHATGPGHGTDWAMVGGLLGFCPDDVRLRDAFAFADARDFRIEMGEVDLGPQAHPNSAELEVRRGGVAMNVRAASVGGGSVQIQQIDSVAVDIRGALETVVLWHLDAPGFLALTTALLADANLNVASIRTGRFERGGRAITAIELDGACPAGVLSALRQAGSVGRAARLPVLPGF